jgi:hypothetical protein
LSGLWLAFILLEVKQQNKWYPIPKAHQNDKDVSGCQFLPPSQQSFQCPGVRILTYIFGASDGQEVYWCNRLNTTLILMFLILALSA